MKERVKFLGSVGNSEVEDIVAKTGEWNAKDLLANSK